MLSGTKGKPNMEVLEQNGLLPSGIIAVLEHD